MRRKTYLTPEEQWTRTAAHYDALGRRWSTREIRLRLVAIVLRSDRHALAGDVLAIEFATGAGRQMVVGVTSKGHTIGHERDHSINGRWMTDSSLFGGGRTRGGKAPEIALVELPDELRALPVVHPDVRRFVVETLRAGFAARRVGSCSPALSPKGT